MISRTGLIRYVARRVLQSGPLLLGIVVVNFLLINLAPGDPALLLAGEGADYEYVQSVRREFGLDEAVHVRLARYLYAVARGDFGISLRFRRSVLTVIGERIPVTLLLMGTQFVTSLVFGLAAGGLAAFRRNTRLDYAVTSFSLASYSLPIFWVGQILILVFAFRLDWFPVQGFQSLRYDLSGAAYVLDVLRHMALPIAALTLVHFTIFARLYRTSLVGALQADYIRTARAKGLAESRIAVRHATPNALLPVITMFGLRFGFLLSGSVIVETVFAWPGIGRLLYESVFARDYPVLMGLFILTSAMVIVANLLADILYAFADPRIRFG